MMCSVAVTEIVFIIAQGYKVFCVQICGSVGNINAQIIQVKGKL